MNYNQLVEEHYEAVYRFCYYFMGSKQDAEDLTQEVFIKANKKLSTLQSESSAKSWLLQIARNKCIDRKRWWKRLFALKEQVGAIQLQSSHSPDMKIMLEKALNLLSARQKEVFICRHFMDYSTEQTAELLGINSGSVKSHLSRAIEKMSKELE